MDELKKFFEGMRNDLSNALSEMPEDLTKASPAQITKAAGTVGNIVKSLSEALDVTGESELVKTLSTLSEDVGVLKNAAEAILNRLEAVEQGTATRKSLDIEDDDLPRRRAAARKAGDGKPGMFDNVVADALAANGSRPTVMGKPG